MEILNWKLFSHPVNWLIVMLMLLIFGFAFELIATHLAGGLPNRDE